MARLYLDDPDRLHRLWAEHVGVPLELGTRGEIFNLGMRFAGHRFMYDPETFARLCAECGFEARLVSYNQSDVPGLRDIDLRGPHNSISMHFDCYAVG
jgi:hypothetical protein